VILKTRPKFFQDSDAGLFYCLFLYIPAFIPLLWPISYLASGRITKAMIRLGSSVKWVIAHFDIQEKPLQTIGFIFALLSSLFYLVTVLSVGWITSLLWHENASDAQTKQRIEQLNQAIDNMHLK
jgi:hypothetical protein